MGSPAVGTRVQVRPGCFVDRAVARMHDGQVGVVVPESAVPPFAIVAAGITRALGVVGDDEPAVFVLYDAPDGDGKPWFVFLRVSSLVVLPEPADPEQAREETYIENTSTDPDDLVELQCTPDGDRG